MKRLIFLFSFIGIATIYFSCSDTGPINSEFSTNDRATISLEKKTLSYFSGTSVTTAVIEPGRWDTLPNGNIHVRGLIVQTNDDLNDPRVDGIVTWVVNMDMYPDGSDNRWGRGDLAIENVGRWDMNYVGWFIPGEGLTYEVDGHGKGDLRGLKAHWTYFLENPPGIFEVHGYIEEK